MQTKEIFTFLKLSMRRVFASCSKTQRSVSTHFLFVFWISYIFYAIKDHIRLHGTHTLEYTVHDKETQGVLAVHMWTKAS